MSLFEFTLTAVLVYLFYKVLTWIIDRKWKKK